MSTLSPPAVESMSGREASPGPGRPGTGSRRRITLVTSGLLMGGAELQLTQLATGLIREGWQVSVLSMQRGGPYLDILRGHGVEVTVVPTGRLASPAQLARLAAAIVRRRPDILQTHAFRANLWGRLTGVVRGIPTVASVRATYSYLPPAYLRVERALGRRCARVITPSDATSRHLVEVAGVPADRVLTIPNGVDVQLFTPDRDPRPQRATWGLDGSRFTVLCAARFVRVKNHAGLLRAFERLARRHPASTLVLAGDGPLRGDVAAAAQATGLDIRLVGALSRSEMAAAIAAADAVALMSDVEGLPNTVLEAMAAGRAVVATAVDGTAEVLDHGRTGLLVERGDEEAMAGALLRLAHDRGLGRHLGESAARVARDRYSIATNVRRHIECYTEAIAT